MTLRKRNEIWWIHLFHNGQRIRRTTRTSARAVAERQHDELAARLHQEKQTGHRFSGALLSCLDEKPRTQKDINNVKLSCAEFGDRPLVEISAACVEKALWKNRGPGGYNRLMVIVRSAMNIALRKEWRRPMSPSSPIIHVTTTVTSNKEKTPKSL